MTRALLAMGLLLAAAPAAAQSAPNIMKPKQAAARAVAATNRAVEANSTLPADAPAQQARAQRAEAARPAAATRATATRATATDSASGSAAVSNASSARARGVSLERETFDYARSGRRDPFVSLMTTGELRPLISDLRLSGVTYGTNGRGSVAVLRDLNTKDQYRVKVGQSLGRMRVAAITPRAVVFTIEEFGYSRQETLPLLDSNKERKQ